ncbi:MAG TPA: TadE/TadG family type IV pilus assembly protein [Gemmataceae bacterium]|nr:TadE/TadG family type IV pilus assembly protein [Gemmataceae bacterium]
MMQTLRTRRRAATLVEFALVAPLFFVFVLGFAELGRGYMVQHLLNNAARQGCRVAVVEGKTNTDVSNAVSAILTPQGIGGDTVSVQINNISGDAGSAQSGDEVTVLVSVPASSVSWVPGAQFLFGTITGQSTLRRE